MVISFKMVTVRQVTEYLDNMKFELRVNEIDSEAYVKMPIVKSFSNEIGKYFKNRNYGNDLKSIIIIPIIVKHIVGFEEWYKVRKPKFIERKDLQNRITGKRIIIEKEFIIETRLNNEEYNTFISSTDEDIKKLLAREILSSLSNLDALPKKVKDFDKERFKADMHEFFKEKNLI